MRQNSGKSASFWFGYGMGSIGSHHGPPRWVHCTTPKSGWACLLAAACCCLLLLLLGKKSDTNFFSGSPERRYRTAPSRSEPSKMLVETVRNCPNFVFGPVWGPVWCTVPETHTQILRVYIYIYIKFSFDISHACCPEGAGTSIEDT